MRSEIIRQVMCGAIAGAFLLSCGGASWGKTIRMAVDGSGDYKTLAEAIAAVPDNSTEETVIHLGAGRYVGPNVIAKTKCNITFEGEGVGQTILTHIYNTNEPNPPGVDRFHKGTGLIVNGSDFHAHDVTFENASGDHGQALALRIDGDRAVVWNCQLIGWQDTLMINKGRMYFKNCYIAGRVDFIYGDATAWFEACEIHSRNGGFATAASTPENQPFGFVFSHCKLTGDSIAYNPATTNPATSEKTYHSPEAALGRPWRPYASVTYLNCEMGNHIKPEGWDNWGKASNEATARYAEYKSTGPGANSEKRAKWSRQLSDDEAAAITVEKVLGGADHWKPEEVIAGAGP